MFDRHQLQTDFRQHLHTLLATDTAVSTGQLYNFLEAFLDENNERYQKDDTLNGLEDSGLQRMLRLILVYTTIALAIPDDAVFTATLEVFPTEEIPTEWAALALDILAHIAQHPENATAQFLMQDMPTAQMQQRVYQLHGILAYRFADAL